MSRGENINCAYCENETLSKNEIGLNKKLVHPQIERMMCLTCTAEYLETTEDELKEMIERFKREGCSLFG